VNEETFDQVVLGIAAVLIAVATYPIIGGWFLALSVGLVLVFLVFRSKP